MMKDWTDIIGEQLGTMGEPLPADDWKVLQQKHSSLKRARKVAVWRWTGSIAAAAAVLLIFFIFQQDENTPSVNLMAEEIAPTEEILPVKEILPHSSSADPHMIPVIPDNSSVAPDNTSVASGSSSAGTGNCTAVAKKDSDAAAAVQIASESSQNETSEESQLRDTTLLADELPDELPEETRRNKRRRPVSISFSGAVPTPTQSVNETSYGAVELPADTIPQNGKIPIKALPQNSNYDIYDHKMPISVGLSARYFINDILAINSGINYTRYESERRKNPSINRESSTQKVHYVGIPVRFDLISANRKGFSLYAGAGMQADKCIWATAWGERLREKEVIWSVTCAAGLQLNITPTASIYLEPEFSRTLNTGSLQTYRTEEKSIRYLRAGVRFTL